MYLCRRLIFKCDSDAYIIFHPIKIIWYNYCIVINKLILIKIIIWFTFSCRALVILVKAEYLARAEKWVLLALLSPAFLFLWILISKYWQCERPRVQLLNIRWCETTVSQCNLRCPVIIVTWYLESVVFTCAVCDMRRSVG